jgi:hypothetical protein
MYTRDDASDEERSWYQRCGPVRGRADGAHAIAFWCLILFLAGAVAGMAVAFKYHSSELSKATRLGCLIHDGITYELKQR